MNDNGVSEKNIFAFLNETKARDTTYERVLSAMCTHPHEIAVKAHMQFIESNLGDFGLFPGTHDLELEVMRMMGDLMNGPSVHGYVTTGGTESNIQALRAMRNICNVKNPNVIIPESAHFSFDKIADMLDIEIRKAALDPEFKVDMDSMKSLVDEHTIGLVGIAGTTEFGQIDPIREMSELAVEKGIFLHVDAAFGGFVIPFLKKPPAFDFSLEGVTSIGIDPHKMGLSTIPSGGLLFRDFNHLHHLQTSTPYLTIDTQYSLTGTRSGATVAGTYAVMKHLGKEGYRHIVDQCMKLTDMVVAGARKFGIEPLIEPVMNVVALDVPDADLVRKRLRDEFGWQVSITRTPRALRLVLMPHLTSENIELFLNDLEIVCDR
ncbi:MAG: tyrosine decarboxylase MfnA [Methanosarcinaceae archaeon]|nr:tyrosine decarboxylase MfnA [Methanosarcinaceae archaeon]MDF1532970.1 tyrosine decarboxylase MfnA [Methanosarcinaceae archaeon]